MPKRRGAAGEARTTWVQNWLPSAVVVLLLAIAMFFLHSQTTAQAHQMSDLEKALLALMKGMEEEHSKTEDSLRQTQDSLRQTQDSLRQTQENLRQTQDKMEEEHSKTEDSLRQTQDKMEQSIRRTQEALGKLSMHSGRPKGGTNFLSLYQRRMCSAKSKKRCYSKRWPRVS